MSIINNKGSVALEFVCAIVFFVAFIFVVQLFSRLSGDSHALSVQLQNDVEKKMIAAGRPPCLLEEFGESVIRANSKNNVFGENFLQKGIVFVSQPYCSGGEL